MSWFDPQTATTAAKALGIDPKTMNKRLRDRGHEIGQNRKYTLAEIVAAYLGDLEAERIRETRANADLKELELRRESGELVSMDEVQSMMNKVYLPMRQRLNALPSEMAAKTNPTDPEHARAQLNSWVDQALVLIREQLPKPIPEKPVKAKKATKKKPEA